MSAVEGKGSPSSRRKHRKDKKERHRKSSRRSRSRSPRRDRDRDRDRDRRKSRKRSPSRERRRSSSRARRHRRSSSRDRRRHRSPSRDRHRRRSPSRDRRRHRRSSSRDRHRRRRSGSRRRHRSSRTPSLERKKPVGVSVSALLSDVLAGRPTTQATYAATVAAGGGLPGVESAMPVGDVALALPTPESKPARELYIGGIPGGMAAAQLQVAFNQMLATGGATVSAGDPIIRVWLSPDSAFAFVEFRSIEETNAALLYLDNKPLMGSTLKCGRPKSYESSPYAQQAAPAGPMSSPTLATVPSMTAVPALAAEPVGAAASPPPAPAAAPSAQPADGAGGPRIIGPKVVVGNIPSSMAEDALLPFFGAFGTVLSCELLKDPTSGLFKGVVVVEYPSYAEAETAVKMVPAVPIGNVVLHAKWGYQSHELFGEKSVWVEMSSIAVVDELGDAELVEELKEDVQEECGKYGAVTGVRIPVPKDGPAAALGMVYVKFAAEDDAGKAAIGLRGRKFDGRTVATRWVQPDDVPACLFSWDFA